MWLNNVGVLTNDLHCSSNISPWLVIALELVVVDRLLVEFHGNVFLDFAAGEERVGVVIPIIHHVYEAIIKLQVEHGRLSRRVHIHKLVIRWAGAFSELATELTKIHLLVGRSVVFYTIEAGLVRLESHLSNPMLHHSSAKVDCDFINESRLFFYLNLFVERLFVWTHCESYACNWTNIFGFLIFVVTDYVVLADQIPIDIDSVKEFVIAGYMILGTDILTFIFWIFSRDWPNGFRQTAFGKFTA